jgi:hypothetical protein
MKGRATGSKENNRAAEYIAAEFRKAGLAPLNGKSYFQNFQVTVGAKLGKQNRAEFTGEGGPAAALELNRDYVPLNFSDSGEANAGVVFAGYGITAPEYRYDDYTQLEVKDKVVMVLRNEPQKNDEKSLFDGRQPTQHSTIVHKAINARNHGARAMVLVNDAPAPGEQDLLVKFGSLTGPDNAGILLIHVTRAAADAWLAASGKTLEDLEKAIDARLEPQSQELAGARLRLRVDVQRIRARTRNVAGLLRGSDPQLAGEAVVLGAHFDHLGTGNIGGSLAPSQVGSTHPGADDNASGTAVLLELARALAAGRAEVKRSVVFIAFSGEELGLLGSSYFTKNPLWPLEKTAAMVNFDMVGRPRENKLYVGGVGTSPVFPQLLEKANAATRFQLSFQQSGYGSSDHSSFYVKNLPVLFFFSGLHSDYHKPSDTPEKIQYADQARVAELGLRVAAALAGAAERPAFVRVQEARPVMGGGGGYGAYFGSVPDMGEEVEGVKFADVRDASPAAKAGLKAGDILIEFAGKPIKNLYDFTFALQSHRPGETVKVVVLRGGKPMSVDVKLEQRR